MDILGIIIILLSLVGIGVTIWYCFGCDEADSHKSKVGFLWLSLTGLVVGIILLAGTISIGAGHRGVVLLWGGQVESRVMGEGLNFKIPFVESVVVIDVRVQAHPFKDIDAASKEMQSVRMTGNINWHFDPSLVYSTYQQIGANKEFVDKVLDSALKDFLKEVTPNYSINEILTKRPEIRASAVNALSLNLSRYHILIDDIYIADIQFSVEYLAAIERQQVAERQVTTEKNLLEQKKIQAEQAKVEAEGRANAAAATADGQKRAQITTAEGDRQSAIIRAEGQASAITTVANAQANANETINKTLTDPVIRYTLVQKLSDDIRVVILPSGEQFILGPEVIGGK